MTIDNGRPPENYRASEYIPNTQNGDVWLQDVPAYDWSFGCSNTAAAMLVGYYDHHGWEDMYTGPAGTNGFAPLSKETVWFTEHCPLSATEKGLDGRTTFEISGLQNCTPYYFSVKAINDQGQSVFSPEKEIVIIESANQNIQYVFDDYYLNYSTTLDDNYYFDGDLIIGSGITATLGGINTFGENSKIVIEPGGKLIIDGGTCTAPCNQTWQGIEVWGDPSTSQHPDNKGYLVLKNGAIIENAVSAVELWKPDDYLKTGGIVQATDAIFRNNAKSVHALWYNNFIPNTSLEVNNLSYFKECTFEITEDFIGTSTFYKHVDLAKVKGIQFEGCDFTVADVPGVSIWSAGIAAFSAGFSLMPVCTTNTIPCSGYRECTFTGFNSAIYAGNPSGLAHTFAVHSAEFVNNTYGIRVEGINNFSVLFSEFQIGHNAADQGECEGMGMLASGYGISSSNATGFAIEENTFTKMEGAPRGTYTGIRIAETQATDQVYKNTFEGLSYGNYAVGKNWWREYQWQGLAYYCNENTGNYEDFTVEDRPDEDDGIQDPQGSELMPAGNTFSENANYNFNNWDFNDWIGYYYYAPSPGVTNTIYYPDIVNRVTREQVVDIQNPCLSHYGGGGSGEGRGLVLTPGEKQEAEQEFAANLIDYNNVKALFDNLKDGGNTDATLSDIETSWPTDTWELRAELLGNSPHLSKEVLMLAADKTEVLPESILFEVLAANPDELRKEELIKYLEDKENPLPQYMIDILRQVAYGTTYKTALQNQMAESMRLKTRAANDMIRSILNDSISDLDELRNWLDNLGGLKADQQIIETYLAQGNVDDALALAGMTPQLYQLSNYDLDEHTYYTEMLDLRVDLLQQGRSYDELTGGELAQLENLAQNSHGTAGAQARAILEQGYGQHFCDCLNITDNQGFKNSAINPALLNQALGVSLTVEPNPARDWAAFDYTLPETAGIGLIKITDVNGKVIKSVEVSQAQGQYLWDTREIKPGVYFYTFVVNGTGTTSKLVITK